MHPPLLGPEFPLPLDEPFTYREARLAGLSRRLLGDLVEHGLLRHPLKGIYLAAQAPDTPLVRAKAVRLRVPDGFVVTDESAGWLAGAEMILRPGAHLEPPPVTIFACDEGHDRLCNGLVASGTRQLLPRDITELHGVRLTTPLRTALDLGRLRHRDRAIAALDQLLRLGVFTLEELLAEVERFRRQRGVRQLRVLAPLADARSESAPESTLRLRCHDVGLRAEPQQDIHSSRGRFLGRVDLLVELLRLILEYDGELWHDDEDTDDDSDRRDAFEREQYTVRVLRRDNLFGPHQDANEILTGAATEARRNLARYLIE